MKYRYIFYPFLIISFCGIYSKSVAQGTDKNYYDNTWKKCDSLSATYITEIQKTDSGYYRRNYFANNSRLQMAALYEDSKTKTGNGYATYFYGDGSLKRQVQMAHGETEGMDIAYYSNGQMSDSGIYHNGQPMGAAFRWHYNGMMADSIAAGNDSIRVHVSWFDDGTPAAAGREVKGKETGIWTYYYHSGGRAAREVYENGKALSVQQFDEAGKEMPLDTNRNEKAPVFKGGIKGWQRYLERSLEWPTGYSFNNRTQATLLVEMTVGEDGKVQNVRVVNPLHPAFDKVAYEVVRKAPDWQPAIQHNRLVPYRFVQSITFALQ